MKKICLIFSSNFLFLTLCFSQVDSVKTSVFLKNYNTKVSIYSSSLCLEEKYSIFQDSIFEHFYALEIIGNSTSSFEVKINAQQFNSPVILGWILKKDCAVFLNKNRDLKLFKEPNIYSSYVSISLSKDIMANIIDVDDKEKNFVKVSYVIDNKRYEGWVRKYCGNIYNSCN